MIFNDICHSMLYIYIILCTEISDIRKAMHPHVINARRDTAKHTSLINHWYYQVLFSSMLVRIHTVGEMQTFQRMDNLLCMLGMWSTLLYFCISDYFRKNAAILSKPHGGVLSINIILCSGSGTQSSILFFQQNCFFPHFPPS